MQVLAALSNEKKEREARAVRAEEAMARDEKKYQKKVLSIRLIVISSRIILNHVSNGLIMHAKGAVSGGEGASTRNELLISTRFYS